MLCGFARNIGFDPVRRHLVVDVVVEFLILLPVPALIMVSRPSVRRRRRRRRRFYSCFCYWVGGGGSLLVIVTVIKLVLFVHRTCHQSTQYHMVIDLTDCWGLTSTETS